MVCVASNVVGGCNECRQEESELNVNVKRDMRLEKAT